MGLATRRTAKEPVGPSSTPCVFRTACGTTYFAQVRNGEGRRVYLGTSTSEAELASRVEAWKKAHGVAT